MNSKKPWTTPELRKIPYAEIIGILRLTLKQAEQSAALNPNDQETAELVKSLRRQWQYAERKNPAA